MNDRTQAVRTALRGFSRKDAVALVKSFDLDPLEETCIIGHVMGKSCVEISMEQNVSVETVKRRRNAALARIAAELNI
jgi:DNA-directed RNA polymerase specialized sigma24 family protein